MPHIYDTCSGSIRGLYLLPDAWDVLHRENIETLDQLRASADQLEQFDSNSGRMAQVIRQALTEVGPSEEQTESTKQQDSWGA
jgi:hypothetical protein